MGKPLISIITAVYNGEEFLKEAIDSVLSQSFGTWELIIVNDGSTDNTEKIINTYLKDKRIKCFNQKNLGVSAARNIGMKNMRGEYFCFLDADDILPKNSLFARLNVFQRSPKIMFADGQVDIFRENPNEKIRNWQPGYKGPPLRDLVTLSGKIFFGNTWMVKRVPGYNYAFKTGLTHGEDLWFYIQLTIELKGEYSYTDDAVLFCRSGNDSAMKNTHGLEKGYWDIYNELLYRKDIPGEWVKVFHKKIKSIMFKSYVAEGKLISAAKMLFR